MGIRTARVIREAPEVRELFYGDGVYCSRTKRCAFQTYILDNKANESVIDKLLCSKGIKLMISPTGTGKSCSLVARARILTAQEKDCKVIIALPSRMLAVQVGSQPDVYTLIGGDTMDEDYQIFATTYEKMFEIEEYILRQRASHKKEKIYLILDECHFLTTQHLFRERAIKGMIRCIEQNLFDSVLLITATPYPMSLFRCNEIVEFESTNKTPAIDKIEIIVVDDVLEYIKSLDYKNEFPFIRLNNEKKMEELMGAVNQKLVKITSNDKNEKEYLDIANDSKIDSTGIDGILCTSVLETGVSITDYPENIVPIAAFENNHISADDMEQFFNRIRRTGQKHVKCARVVLKRPNKKEVRAALVTVNGSTVCEFEEIDLKMGDVFINDASKMDAVADGTYKLRIEIGRSVSYRNFEVSSLGKTNRKNYSKDDSRPLMLPQVGFRPFIHILKANYQRVEKFRKTLQEYVTAFEKIRESRKQAEKMSDWDFGLLKNSDDTLIETMTKGAIGQMGELSECVSYEKGEIVLDKRILYMVSYSQFQRQYYYNHELLKRELEERMNTRVVIRHENTAKGKATVYNADDIWEDIEDLRQMIVNNCFYDYWDALMGSSNLYTQFKKSREKVYGIRGQAHLIELLREMEKSGIKGALALKILTSSKKKAKVTRYQRLHGMIIFNQALNKFTGESIQEIPFYNRSQEEKVQAAIYCYLEQKGQSSYKVTNELAEDILRFYKASFPLSTKLPTKRMIKGRMKQMYRTKGKDTVRKQLRLKEDEIFELEEADY